MGCEIGTKIGKGRGVGEGGVGKGVGRVLCEREWPGKRGGKCWVVSVKEGKWKCKEDENNAG